MNQKLYNGAAKQELNNRTEMNVNLHLGVYVFMA